MANTPDEIKTAEASDQVTKATGDTVIVDRHGPKPQQGEAPTQVTHKRGSGFGVTSFDNVAPAPHLRAKVADDPTGAKNKKLLEEHKAAVAAETK